MRQSFIQNSQTLYQHVDCLPIMDTSQFYFFVLPLVVLVFLMAFLVFYYARRMESAQKKVVKLVNSYVKTTSRQKESFGKQLDKLHELRESGSIDEVTYERMKHALEYDYTKKRENAKTRLSSTQNDDNMSSDTDDENTC